MSLNRLELGRDNAFLNRCSYDKPCPPIFRDTGELVLAGWNFEGLRAGILAGFLDKGLWTGGHVQLASGTKREARMEGY
jgi:hypothetical protein